MADPADPLGFDVFVSTDMAPDGRSSSGAELVRNAVLHRLMADTLPLVDAPGGVVDYGVNVSSWVGEVTTDSDAAAKGPLLAMVIGRDPRVDTGTLSVVVTVMPDGADVDLQIAISFRTTSGVPISMVVGVTAVSVELLSQGT